ncbi:RCC1/BLIP-II protein [Peniophora sp. CONT]|nr:RCC1/BLIP-II protein [Peniophora sp. CONT]
MPPRRARQPTADAAPAAKPTRASNRTATKRAASPESSRTPPPVAKRSRSAATKKNENDAEVAAPAPRSKRTRTTTPAVEKAATKEKAAPKEKAEPKKKSPVEKKEKVMEPPFIAIPQLPEPVRPCNQIFVWGCGDFGQFGLGPEHMGENEKPRRQAWVEKKIEEDVVKGGVVAIASGGMHSLFTDEQGTVFSMGVNDDAALGRKTAGVPNPENPDEILNADLLSTLPAKVELPEGYQAVSIAAGDSISAAISNTGELRVWGSFRANEGALGFATGMHAQFVPAHVLPNEKIVQVATGNNHLLVLTSAGHIYSWGAGEQGQLGRRVVERRKINGTNPERVVLGSRGRRAVLIGAGNMHSFAVDEAGDVWGWGLNGAGQTGTGARGAGTDAEAVVQNPLRVPGLSTEELGNDARVVEISGGDLHTLFLTSDGRVYACGRADAAALGLPKDHEALADGAGSVNEPVRVPFPDEEDDDPVVHISAGTTYSAAVTKDGALYTWGEGSQSELGQGERETSVVPGVVVRREGGRWGATAVSCGGQHAMALLRPKDV